MCERGMLASCVAQSKAGGPAGSMMLKRQQQLYVIQEADPLMTRPGRENVMSATTP